MPYTIERATSAVEVGEGPHWDAETQTLYYVDLVGASVHKYNPSTNEHTKANIGICPSFIIPLENTTDKFLISMLHDIVIITWDGVSNKTSNIEKIAEAADIETSNNRFNDGKADPAGILWAGTMDRSAPLTDSFPKNGNLYSLNRRRCLKHHIGSIQISNGLAWNPNIKRFYYIDSMKRTVDEFAFDSGSELISNRRSIFSLQAHNIPGFPDGQALDTDGNLWVAIYNGARVIQINPRIPNTLLQTIAMPANKVTSVTFGGSNLDELYVTTGRVVTEGEALPTSADGITYRITGLGVKGYGGVRVTL